MTWAQLLKRTFAFDVLHCEHCGGRARVIAAITERWGLQAIRIGAQARLKDFYQRHGFTDAGVPYVEDGIDHLEMLWQPAQ